MSDAEIPPTAESFAVRAVPPVVPQAEPALAPAPFRAATALDASRPPAQVTAQGHKPGRGDIRTAALSLLSSTDQLNGYQIVQLIAERSSGVWQPSPGAVYPALQQLEADALIEQVEGGTRKTYRLTDAGRAHAAGGQSEAEALWRSVESATDPRAQEIDTLCGQVVTAVRHALHDADDARYAGTRQVLLDARRSLYRMLAEEDDRRS
ncbi:PadR family transcriptional regulator [Streptomyces sp. NBC_00249]|uniref:PadR family transcriptional regulator n=1 Tax=Streptomyces sp. NBC_00249 TaxID=2975690 RepID=UPI002254D0ED|nr:PadR family transcriptional regulator [Streptomyces sp. NBC_00249]MCX5199473.1 PadR family transcriptional regulator [Streptomyces sp. NBC_00249]